VPVRAADFRYIFANTLGLQLTDNEAKIIFGVTEEPGKVEGATEQVGIFMTHKTLKLLSRLLADSVAHYEKSTGVDIPFDEEKTENLRKQIEGVATPPSE